MLEHHAYSLGVLLSQWLRLDEIFRAVAVVGAIILVPIPGGGVRHEHVLVAILVGDPGLLQIQARSLEWDANVCVAAVSPLQLTEAFVMQPKVFAVIAVARPGFLRWSSVLRGECGFTTLTGSVSGSGAIFATDKVGGCRVDGEKHKQDC